MMTSIPNVWLHVVFVLNYETKCQWTFQRLVRIWRWFCVIELSMIVFDNPSITSITRTWIRWLTHFSWITLMTQFWITRISRSLTDKFFCANLNLEKCFNYWCNPYITWITRNPWITCITRTWTTWMTQLWITLNTWITHFWITWIPHFCREHELHA